MQNDVGFQACRGVIATACCLPSESDPGVPQYAPAISGILANPAHKKIYITFKSGGPLYPGFAGTFDLGGLVLARLRPHPLVPLPAGDVAPPPPTDSSEGWCGLHDFIVACWSGT